MSRLSSGEPGTNSVSTAGVSSVGCPLGPPSAGVRLQNKCDDIILKKKLRSHFKKLHMTFTPFYQNEQCYFMLRTTPTTGRIYHVRILRRLYEGPNVQDDDLDDPMSSTTHDHDYYWVRFHVQNLEAPTQIFHTNSKFLFKTREQAEAALEVQNYMNSESEHLYNDLEALHTRIFALETKLFTM